MDSPAYGKRKLLYHASGAARNFRQLALTLLALLVFHHAKAQNISLSVKNEKMEKVFLEVEKQTPYRFVFSHQDLANAKPVTLQLRDAGIELFLSRCLANQPFSFTRSGNTIVIQAREQQQPAQPPAAPSEESFGQVISQEGAPIAGATIEVKGSTQRTLTDANGKFSLQALQGATLRISSIGYEPMEVLAGPNLSVTLRTRVNMLDETVVIAYGTTSRRLNTGSVARVSGEEIRQQPVSNPMIALQGRVPGLMMTQNNGLPGANFNIIIRGQGSIQNGNAPLYIIDGVPFLSNTDRLVQSNLLNANSIFNTINPADIESIEVLKDADATAIYGSRGANGVILITTRKARPGKISLDLDTYTGFGKVTRTMDMMNTAQYLEMRKEAFQNDGITPTPGNAPDLLLYDQQKYTDFKKLLIGGTARLTNIQLNLSGGTETGRFTMGMNYNKETSVFPRSIGNERWLFSLGSQHYSPQRVVSIQTATSFARNASEMMSMDVTSNIRAVPNLPDLYDSLGRLNWRIPNSNASFTNPLAVLNRSHTGITDRLTHNSVLGIAITKDLRVSASAGYNYVMFNEVGLTPISSQNPASSPKGSANMGKNQFNSWILEPQINYGRKLGSHLKLETTFGATWNESKNEGILVNASGFTNDDLLHSISAASNVTTSNTYSLYRYQAIFGRINMNWDGQYLLNLTGRRDGSSRFGKDRQFANFGAIGAGWIFSSAKFFEKFTGIISFGKMRGSYGITGNDQIGDYQYLDTWTTTQYPYQGQAGLQPTRHYNPNYSWEQLRKLDLGLELGFFDNRILLNADYFIQRSDNQIIRYNLPLQTGFPFVLQNFPGQVENRGLELDLSGTPVKAKHITWNSQFNITIARNKLLAFPNLENSSYANTYIIGQPLSVRRGFNFLGVNPATGVYEFEDLDGDGQLTTKDHVIIGHRDPRYFGSFINTITAGRLSASFHFFFISQQGNDAIYNNSTPVGLAFNQPLVLIDRWRKPGDEAVFQRYTQSAVSPAFSAAANRLPASSAAITGASYIRLRNVSLSYQVPATALKKLRLQGLRIYMQGQNLLLFTNYRGADPENQNITTLPLIRMITTGININL